MRTSVFSRLCLQSVHALCILLFALWQASVAGETQPGIPAVASQPVSPLSRMDNESAMMTRLYGSGVAPGWLANGQEQARMALGVLQDAATHGLDPRHYGADALARRLGRLRADAPDDGFERDLSAAMLRFLTDLRFGHIGSPYRRAPDQAAAIDLAERLRGAVNGRRLAQAVEWAAPALPLYGRVRTALARYRELALLAPAWPELPASGRAGLVAGSPYAGAPLLRERLRILGDLDSTSGPADEQVVDAGLVAGVKRFQSRHGLAEDGVLGPATLAALAVPPARRVAQLALTLERLRWLPPQSTGRIVTINVPAYRLWAIDLDHAAAEPIEMRVIVGKAAGTPTPLFIGQMRHLEFNPYWNVPRSIAVGEIVPKLARNARYLQQNDMELVAADGRVLSAGAADARARIRAGSVRVRQRPGPMNVLGEVKFAMPNPMNIYLHSTSSKELFQRTRRDLSHGCIRVEQPAELAEFVLADKDNWSASQVRAAMQPGPTRKVVLAAPVPVVLFYATAVVDRAGRALFTEDIYRLDPPLLLSIFGEN